MIDQTGNLSWRFTRTAFPQGSPMNSTTKLYERDFYAWTLKNAELLRQGRLGEIDLEHLAEELDSMERSEKR